MPADTATTAGGLPKRRRRAPAPTQAEAEPAAGTQAAPEPAPVEEHDGRSAEETARRMGAFARGTLHGRAAVEDPAAGRAARDTTPHEDEGNIHG